MKKIITLIVICTFINISCKKENKEESTTPNVSESSIYSIDSEASAVQWTGYKTSDKAAVKGVFTKINLNNTINSKTKHESIEGLQFSIPVSSFFSKNEIRDSKIKLLFFAAMEETTMVSGHFSNVIGTEFKGSVSLNLKMNNETVIVPMNYIIANNVISLDGTIENLLDWKMESAFNALHKACEILHTGPDGISKTWTEVAIKAQAVLKKK